MNPPSPPDAADAPSPHHSPMGFGEFVIVIASLMAMTSLATSMMLAVLAEIGKTFGLAETGTQSVLTSFFVGFAVGQFIVGPISDRFGRRALLIGGLALYLAGSLLCIVAPSFETLLAARLIQGLGAAAPRIITISVIRDCYAGRRMASVMSLAMMIFIAVPVIAPSLGQAIMLAAEWHGIFVALLIYGAAMLAWIALRLPETLPAERRRPLAVRELSGNYLSTLTTRQPLGYALGAGCVQGILFGYVFSSQQIFTEIYRLGRLFPLAFAAVAIGIAAAGFLNSRIVGRFGMRAISHGALVAQVALAAILLGAALADRLPLWLFMTLAAANLFAFGLIFSNFSALAMEPQGHIAGTASSLFGSITTLFGIVIGYAIGQSYDGTLVPFAIGSLGGTVLALAIVLAVEKGRLFAPYNRRN